MKTILLPVDGSEHSAKAAALAGGLASRHDAEVVVLYVHGDTPLSDEQRRMAEVEHIVPPGGHKLPWVTNVPAELAAVLHEAQAVDRTQAALDFIADNVVAVARDALVEHGVAANRVRFLVKNGAPAERIVETVADIGADAVVMGSRGLSNFGGMVFGSVSHKVAHEAPCSVITVR